MGINALNFKAMNCYMVKRLAVGSYHTLENKLTISHY